MVGSPPQIETTGAPHSSIAAMHCSTVNISLIVDLYSRMRPQPVQVKLQACSGSSIITSGNLSSPWIRLPTRYLVSLAVSFRGNLIRSPGSHCAARAPPAEPPGCGTPKSPAGCCGRSEEHTSELQSRRDLVCRLLLE